MKPVSNEVEIVDIHSSSKKLVKHVDLSELKSYIRKEADSKLLTRFIFISNLYIGLNIKDAAERLIYNKRTGQRWVNKMDMTTESDKLKTRWNDGRPSKLSEKALKKTKKNHYKRPNQHNT